MALSLSKVLSKKPLNQRLVVITRPDKQAVSMVSKIEALGGDVLVTPAIRLNEQAQNEELSAAVRSLSSFDWVIFTSVNGVRAFAKVMAAEGVQPSLLSQRGIAAIGPATASALQELEVTADVVPAEYVAEALPEALGSVRDKKILMARADIARKKLPQELRELGATVTEIAAYTVVPNDDPTVIARIKQQERKPDYLTFTSSSTVRGFAGLLGKAGKSSWLEQVPIVSIGPITAQTVEEYAGRRSTLVASEYTTDGIVQAIVEYEGNR